MQENNNELMHFGIPGMKWGVRRSRTTNSIIATKKSVVEKAEKKMNSAYKKGSKEDYIKAKKLYNQANKEYKRETKKINELYESNVGERILFGTKAQKKVNNYLNKGYSLKDAKTKAYTNAGAKRVATALVAIGTKIILDEVKKAKERQAKGNI